MQARILIKATPNEIRKSNVHISLTHKPNFQLFSKLIEWGFVKISSNEKIWEAKLGDLKEKRWAVWSFYLNRFGYKLSEGLGGLAGTYIPASEKGMLLETVIPNSMDYETHIAIRKVRAKIGGSIFGYVKKKLKYATDQELETALASEQIDAVALAIYNIEERKQSIILADQTGVGKGRVGAGLMRYAIMQNKVPIFITEKATLFTDFFRDLRDISIDQSIPRLVSSKLIEQQIKYDKWDDLDDSDKETYGDKESYELYCDENKMEMVSKMEKNSKYHTNVENRVVPFILNNKETKSAIKGVEDGKEVIYYEAIDNKDLNKQHILENCNNITKFKDSYGNNYNCIFATYSQFSSDKNGKKMSFLARNIEGNILILDETHNAGGIASKVGQFFQSAIKNAEGVLFISATFAKRPDNFPLFVEKTVLSEASMSSLEFIEAVKMGGNALQEIISAQLVAEGQLVRRERTSEGVITNEIFLTEQKVAHSKISDTFTEIFRDIIDFQKVHVNKALLDTNIANQEDESYEGNIVDTTKGTSEIGLSNTPIFSRTFNLINQFLFSIKADAVADLAIKHLKEGRKPVIAFSSTMGSFLGEMGKVGDYIDGDFSKVLEKALVTAMKFTDTKADGSKEKGILQIERLSNQGQEKYNEILDKIHRSAIGITISPIDHIIEKIEEAGFSVAEVTGRSIGLSFRDGRKHLKDNKQEADPTYGRIYSMDKRLSATDKFKKFNYNEVDVLLINQSGSTGASAQAKPFPPQVPKEKVKQRVMILLQNELNINTEIQKRGRIHRTGQIMTPIYNLVCSEIPAEKRLQIMLQSKLKSLDANTTSNQKTNKDAVGSVVDFMNKYGDICVKDFMDENREIHRMIGRPLSDESKRKNDDNFLDDELSVEGASQKCSSRVAILPVFMQEQFYDGVMQSFLELEVRKKASGDWDLEVQALDLQAETKSIDIAKSGSGGDSLFGKETLKELCEVNNLDKPYSFEQVASIIEKYRAWHEGKSPKEINDLYKQKCKEHYATLIELEKKKALEKASKDIANITSEGDYKRISKQIEKGEWQDGDETLEEYEKRRKNHIQTTANEKFGQFKEKSEKQLFRTNDFLGRYTVGSSYGITSKMHQPHYVFLGVYIDLKLRNPFAPSRIRFKFAVCNYLRSVEFSLTKEESADLNEITFDPRIQLVWFNSDSWNNVSKLSQLDRVDRAILTGNILQSFIEVKGKLISYTCKDGSIKKGILLDSLRDEEGSDTALKSYISTPITRCYDYIENTSVDSNIILQDEMQIHVSRYSYLLRVAKGSKNQKYFLNPKLIALAESEDGFNSSGQHMVATIDKAKLIKLVETLSELKVKVNIPKAQYSRYFNAEVSESTKTADETRAEYEFDEDRITYKQRIEAQRKRISEKPQKSSSNLSLLKLKAEAELEMMEMEMSF